tara:strand:- start:2431 stop:3258 length:828 start_codon:yes stop_codon:yes gene_type:complete
MKQVLIPNTAISFSNVQQFVLIAGPCQVESLQHSIDICGALNEITMQYNTPFVYKSSFDKANRTSINSQRGLGLEKSLQVFEEIKNQFNVPVITDVHESSQCKEVADVVDILQIPAFLCRQTDLLQEAAITALPVMIKKGQFMAPWDMKNVIEKISHINDKILLCERGASFGYNRLVSDMTSLPIMKETKYPVIFDATHSVQQPGGMGATSGGNREFVPVLAKCAITTGIAGLFMEVHKDPDNAPSDGPNMLKLDDLHNLLYTLTSFDEHVKGGF